MDGDSNLFKFELGSWTLRETVASPRYTHDDTVRGPFVLNVGDPLVDRTTNSEDE